MSNQSKNFLENYALYTSQNEVPTVFHTWAAFSALANFVGRKVWVDQGLYKVAPNLYTLFVAPAGIKKSTAMALSERLVQEVGSIPISPAAITKEAMIELLTEKGSKAKKLVDLDGEAFVYHQLAIYSDEVWSLFDCGGNALGYITFLTDVWDKREFEYRLKNRPGGKITYPYINLIGCMTPETMQQMAYQKLISGGFSRRCIIVHATQNEKPIPRPTVTPEMSAAWKALVEKGKILLKTSGAFKWTPTAETLYDEWYTKTNFQLRQDWTLPMYYRVYYNSKPQQVLKVAMLVALAEGEDLVLDDWHIEAALSFLEQIEPSIEAVFGSSGRNELGALATAVENLIKTQKDPIVKKRLYLLLKREGTLKEIDDVIKHLVKAGLVEEFNIKTAAGKMIPVVGAPGSMEATKNKINKKDNE